MNYEALFKINYGLYVICTGDESVTNGYIGNTVMQVTAEPPRLAICCSKNNYTSELIRKIEKLSVSVLNQEYNPEIMGNFGFKTGKDFDKLKTVAHITGKSGVPIVTEDCCAWFECKVISETDVGTHILFIADIIESELLQADATPLSYDWYRENKNGAAPENAPTYIDKDNLEKTKITKEDSNNKYKCSICNYIYNPEEGDPDSGIKPGTAFEDIPDDWVCPICGASKDMFEIIE